ncbi:monoacylglycerol lipase abhd6-A [Nematostella vectensis]|uniref:monoacylglycerol lipase abhd6-A n=1 Tax=Nematostella vectensis TaxID=45351 RepID=UPI002076FC0C|nr:monoacylglycerol lipase abhd6-A [Nematostella vectensis]
MEWFISLFAAAALIAVVFLSACVSVYLLQPSLIVELMQRWSMFWAGFSNNTIRIGDFEFSYIERGREKTTQSTIVLIHGFSSSKDVWCQMSHGLPRSYHLIALDLPGHGKTTRKHHDNFSIPSQVSKLHQFLHAVGVNKRKFHLAGISMGGHIVGVYAAQHPARVASVIMMCPAGIQAPEHSEFITDVVLNGEKNYLIPDTPEDFQKMLNKVLHREVTIPYFIAKLFADVRRPCKDFYQKGANKHLCM